MIHCTKIVTSWRLDNKPRKNFPDESTKQFDLDKFPCSMVIGD